MKKLLLILMVLILASTARAHWDALNLLLNPGFEDPCTGPTPPNPEWPPNAEPNHWGHLQPGWDSGPIAGADANYVSPTSPPLDLAVYFAPPPSGYNGSNSFIAMAVKPNSINSWALCYQVHSAAEKRQYHLEAYVYTDTGSEILSPELKIDFRNSSGVMLRSDIKTFPGLTDGVWTLVTMDSNGSAPDGARTVGATVGTGKMVSVTDYTEVYWDDVTLTSPGDAPNPCELLQFSASSKWDFAAGDLDRNCVIDFKDFALFAQYWMGCNARGCKYYHYGY
jgi:hypothetical protein